MIITICLVVTLESYVFLGGFQVVFSQRFIIPIKQNLSPVSFTAAWKGIHITGYGDNNFFLGKKSMFDSEKKVSAHYPTTQEKERIDRVLNQTLSLLPPLGRAINESHSCIMGAVICGSGNMTNTTMLKI